MTFLDAAKNYRNKYIKSFKDWKLGTKITVSFSILLLIGTCFLGYVSYSGSAFALTRNIEVFSVDNAKDAAKLVETALKNLTSNLEAVAARPEVSTMNWEKQEPVLLKEAERLGYLRLNVIDLTGSARTTDGNTADLSERDYFKKAVQGISNVSDPVLSKFDNKMVMAIAVPIKAEDGSIVGALSATIDYNSLSDLVADIKFGDSGYSFILNSKGTAIAHPKAEFVENGYNSFEEYKSDPSLKSLVEIHELMLSGESGYREYEFGGVKKYAAYAPIKGTDWSIGITTEKSELFGKVESVKRQLIMIIIVFFVVVVLFTLGIIQLVVLKPVKRLLDVTEKLVVGDVEVTTDSDSSDELGTLMRGYGRIIQSIRAHTYAVEKISKGESDIEVEIRSDKDILSKSLMLVTNTLENLENETNKLTAAALEGNLNERGNSEKFSGIYKKIIDGMNDTLDAVIAPVMEEQSVLREMAKGNLNVFVTGDYKGDHAIIKNALNETIKMLSRYIKEINYALDQLSQGNLDIDINGEYVGDFVGIKNSLLKIVSSFNELLGSIKVAAEQVASGARQISDSSQVLAMGATEQATSIEDLTISMKEIGEKTKFNSVKSNDAKTLTMDGSEAAKKGNESMKELLVSIEEINDSSNSISKIIKVIDDIAFQTNILALNAAVEAARAGQYGKGFAVVADEVRNLAEKSALAAKETASLIEGSIKKVEIGTEIANNTAADLKKIVDEAMKSADLLKEIYDSSIEQEAAISRVEMAVNRTSQVIHTNSSTSQETAASSEELSNQADKLMNMVRRFRLKKDMKYSLLDEVNAKDLEIHF
jgi:methyl-accepting chemotaxis protein